MEWKVSSGAAEKQRTACLVTGFYSGQRLSPTSEQLDEVSKGFISSILRKSNLTGDPGHTLLLHNVPGISPSACCSLGSGKKRVFVKKCLGNALKRLFAASMKPAPWKRRCILRMRHPTSPATSPSGSCRKQPVMPFTVLPASPQRKLTVDVL